MSVQKKYVVTAVAGSVVLAALRSLIVFFFLEKKYPETNVYYLPDNGSVYGFAIATAIVALIFILFGIKSGRKFAFEIDQTSCEGSVGSAILSFMLFGAAIVYLVSAIRGTLTVTAMESLVILLTIGSAVVFIFNSLHPNTKLRDAKTLATVTLVPIFFSAFRLLGEFVRTSATPLASSGAFHICGLVAVLLYFLCEGKSYVIGGSAALYFSLGFISVLLLTVYAVPDILLSCFGGFKFDHHTGFSVVDLGLAVYICCRLASVKTKEKQKAGK